MIVSIASVRHAVRPSRRRRGFALLAALGVLAVLTILAAAAAGSVSFTRGLAVERNRERALTSALSHGADLLGARGCEMLKSASASASAAATSTTLLAPAGEGVAVTASAPAAPDRALLGDAFAPRDGDVAVRIEARPTRAGAAGKPAVSAGAGRAAVYLFNTGGGRRSPILLRETRLP